MISRCVSLVNFIKFKEIQSLYNKDTEINRLEVLKVYEYTGTIASLFNRIPAILIENSFIQIQKFVMPFPT
ncbi:hypothetical protein HNR33_000582 [Brassicibacter mesophilus]